MGVVPGMLCGPPEILPPRTLTAARWRWQRMQGEWSSLLVRRLAYWEGGVVVRVLGPASALSSTLTLWRRRPRTRALNDASLWKIYRVRVGRLRARWLAGEQNSRMALVPQSSQVIAFSGSRAPHYGV